MLHVDPADAMPIWRQIEEGVRNLVATGALRPGDVVASVRELARELRVNPLTVAKAYRRLADAGVLVVRRGEGTFVAAGPPRMTGEERRRKLGEAASRYVNVAKTLGADGEESALAVRRAWEGLGRGDEEEGES